MNRLYACAMAHAAWRARASDARSEQNVAALLQPRGRPPPWAWRASAGQPPTPQAPVRALWPVAADQGARAN